MPEPTLSNPAARIEARDAATFAWHDEYENLLAQEDSPRDADTLAAAATAVTDLGYLVASQLYFDNGTRVCPTLTVTACDGSSIVLDWDSRVDGFDYEGSGDDACDLGEEDAQHEDEPEPEPEPEPKTIDITPTWSSLIPLLATMIQIGDDPRSIAIAELTRLARFADEVNARNRDGCGAESETKPFAGCKPRC